MWRLRFGVYKHLRPGGTVRQKGSEKSQKSQPATLASEPDVEISGDATRGGTAQPPAAHQLRGEIPTQIQDSGSTSTSDPAALSAKKAVKKSQKSQLAALASEPDVEISGDTTRGGTATTPCCLPAQRRNPRPNPRFGSTSTSDPAAPSAKKAAKKSQKSQLAALASEPDVEISDSGSTSTSDPAALFAKKAAKKSQQSQPSRPCLRAGCGDLRRRYQRRYSTIPCCPPAQRRNPRPNPRFGVYKHLRLGGTVRQKGSKNKSEVTAGCPRLRAGCGNLRFGIYKHL
jgi:hypothetical protein